MKYLRLALLTLALLIGVSAPAQPAPGKIPPFRFLVLVDSSSNMRKLDALTPTVVHDLIQDGVYGRMLPGDLYSVWTFDEMVDTSFTPPTSWHPTLARAQAQAVDQRIRQIKYGGKAKLEAAVKKLNTIVNQSEDDLTIVIVHDGSGVMFGTPFDLPVTAIYRQFQKDMTKNGRPFITTFLVRDKKMVAWAVDAAGAPPTLPYLPRRPRPGDAPPTNTVSKATKPATSQPEAEPAPAPKKPAPASIIVKGPIKPATSATNVPPVVTAKPPITVVAPAKPLPTPEPKLEVSLTAPKMVTPVSINETAPPAQIATSPAPSTAVTIPSSAPKPIITEPVVTITPSRPEETVKASDIVPIKAEPVKVTEPPVKAAPTVASATTTPSPLPAPAAVAAAKTVDTAAQMAQTAVVVPTGPNWDRLLLGFIFLGAAIAAIIFLMRRNQSAAHGSVISRSMNRDKRP